jgi:dienelactone hydrolase
MSERASPFVRSVAAMAWLCGLALPMASQAAEEPVIDCGVGAYRLDDGGIVDVGTSRGTSLRWRKPDGTTGAFETQGPAAGVSSQGWTQRPDGRQVRIDCAQAAIDFGGVHGRRLALPTIDVRFTSDGTPLAGRLVMPAGDGPVPVVVLLQGSEHDSAMRFDSLQRRFPAAGVGAFVYDKRGTGASGGRYTQDFEQLARDATAALQEARRLAGRRVARIGLHGPSQGGWVAPLAARIAPVDFIIVGYGLAVSVLDEDREAVAMNIAAAGHGAQAMAGAMAVVDACAALALNPIPVVFDRFARVRQRYEGEPWFKDVRGDFCYLLLGLKTKEEFAAFAQHLKAGTPWLFDPMATIAAVTVPQLWILAQDDLEAPSAETARRLAVLRGAGRPIVTAVFPKTEHGIYEYETAADGSRTSTRQPEGYLQLMVDFAFGPVLKPAYGTAVPARPDR